MLGDLSLRDQMAAQQRIDPYRVGKNSARPFAGGLRRNSSDVHFLSYFG
jgi:hypothetical protein